MKRNTVRLTRVTPRETSSGPGRPTDRIVLKGAEISHIRRRSMVGRVYTLSTRNIKK